jgi:hypothetical protein
MKNYKLRKEARQFFNFDTMIEPMTFWETKGVHINLLEEVSLISIEYGKYDSTTLKSMKQHSSINNRAKFHFTINMTGLSSSDYDKLPIDLLMDEFQKVSDSFFTPYLTN